MPHISTAMARSGVADVVLDSILRRQTIPDRVNSVKDTFSSWDGCMAKTYCKWPVIAGIVVLGLILLSIVSCIVRCCCCGMSCCCSCFSFLKCCDCCGGACDGKKNKPMKHLDDPYAHHNGPTSGYQAPASMPMMGGGLGGKPEPPQYAQFEVGSNGLAVAPKPISEDALPPMPSWDSAAKKHVMTEEEKNAVELGNLDPSTGQRVPLMASGAAPGTSIPPSPIHEANASPYGARAGQGGSDGYMGVAAGDPYGQNHGNFGGNGAYGTPSNGPTRGYTSPPQDTYGQNTNFIAAGVPGYNQRPQRQNTGDRQHQNMGGRQYPPQPSRQYSGNSTRPSDRQYSDYPENYNNQASRGPSRGPPNRMASPPNNNAGFEFGASNNQSYSRPGNQQQSSYNSGRRPSPPTGGNDSYYDGSTAAPTYASRSPPPQEPSYSGYQAYQPSEPVSNHHRAPTALRPAGGRDPRQQPQGWDPVNH